MANKDYIVYQACAQIHFEYYDSIICLKITIYVLNKKLLLLQERNA